MLQITIVTTIKTIGNMVTPIKLAYTGAIVPLSTIQSKFKAISDDDPT